MKKLLFSMILGAGLISSGTLSAQRLNLGVNLATGLPMGDFSDGGATFGIGGAVSLDYYFNDKFDVGIEVGFLNFPYEEPFDDLALSMIPIQLTGAYHADLTEVMEFYGELGVGYFVLGGDVADLLADKGYLGVSPRLGLAYELSDRLFLDFNVNYTQVFSGKTYTEDDGFGGTTEVEQTAISYLGFNLGLLVTIGD